MTSHDPGSKSAPMHITEDEAAVYDRQIRLWGLEAQQRMRNATILIMRLRGTATEAIKNIVLAGIGKLVIYDTDDVTEEDLGAGFFFRDEDVGKKRVDAAKARIESLNPLVTVQVHSLLDLRDPETLDALVTSVDLVCATDWSRETLVRVNGVCRRYRKPFYAGGTYGLLGYIFCDLLHHEYIAPDRSAPKDAPRTVKTASLYTPLSDALRHRWTGLSKRQTKQLNPSIVFAVLAIWEYQATHGGALPDDPQHADDLEKIANAHLSSANLNKHVISKIPRHLMETLATTAQCEFSPVCAVVGGMLGQDILKTLAAREPPIANFFTFDGHTGGGTVCAMGIAATQ